MPALRTLTFRPEAYGARGDGSSDDTEAFKLMHAEIIATQARNPGLDVVIELSGDGTYNYTWNRWTWGIQNLTLEGNGAAIRNTKTTGDDADKAILRTNRDFFSTLDYQQREGAPESFGYQIKTATVDSTSVTLTKGADAAHFEVGKWALVASYSQQNGGHPPNARYFDWVKVTAIDGRTVSFDHDPLQHEHRDDWPSRAVPNDSTPNPGDVIPEPLSAAVIVPAEREIPIGQKWLIKDLTALASDEAGDAGRSVQIEGVLHAEFQNVTFPHWAGGQVKELIFRDSEFASSEPDKIVDLLRIENSTAGVTQVTGINRIEIVDSVLPGRNNIQAREMFIDGSTFDGARSSWGPLHIDTFVPIFTLEVTNSVFNGVGNRHWPIITDARPIIVTIGENGLALAGDDLLLSGVSRELWGTFDDPNGLINRAYEGQFVQLLDQDGYDKGYGEIETIRANGGLNTARIDVDWSVNPRAGDKLKIYGVAEVVGDNNVMNNVHLLSSYDGVADVRWNGVDIQNAPWLDASIPAGRRPLAVDDAALKVAEDGSLTIREGRLLRNDTDPDGDSLELVAVSHAVNGEVVLNGNGRVTFTPDADHYGPARFRYTVRDGDGNSDSAQVRLDVAPREDALIARDDAGFAVHPNMPRIISAATLLANDTNVDDDPLAIVTIRKPAHGKARIDGDGNVVFTPQRDYEGPATFTYVATDGNGGRSAATVSLFVAEFSPPNEPVSRVPTNSSDFLLGTDLDDLRFALGGDDVLDGRGGDDVLEGGGGHDTLFGRGGSDILLGSDGNDVLDGGDGDDILSGDANDDELIGGGGDDFLFGEQGSDVLSGVAGDDVLYGGGGPDTLLGGSGRDILKGQSGPDVLNGGADADTLTGGGGSDILRGRNGRDTLDGGAGDDTLHGQAMDDLLTGRGGGDSLFGGAGSDLLKGLGGHDLLNGGDGDDTLFGGTQADTLEGGHGNDTLVGGAGADVFRFHGNFGSDLIADFGAGRGDQILFASNLGVDAFADLDSNASGVLDRADRGISIVGGDTVITFAARGELTVGGATDLMADDVDFF